MHTFTWSYLITPKSRINPFLLRLNGLMESIKVLGDGVGTHGKYSKGRGCYIGSRVLSTAFVSVKFDHICNPGYTKVYPSPELSVFPVASLTRARLESCRAGLCRVCPGLLGFARFARFAAAAWFAC